MQITFCHSWDLENPVWIHNSLCSILQYLCNVAEKVVVVYCGKCINKYGLLTKCEVKMAGYWPSSFFVRFGSS